MADEKDPTGAASRPDDPYAAAKADLESALRLGVEVERDDPDLGPVVSTLTDRQVAWVASWLAGEGFARRRDPSA